MIKESKLKSDLMELVNTPSSYSNVPCRNLLYWDGRQFTADCVNLYKALFNGRDITYKEVGSFQSDLSKTGDCSEYDLLRQCEVISWGNFTNLSDHFECLYMAGHFGGYYGEEFEIDGRIYNVVEATAANTDYQDGIVPTYVDQYGNRLSHKGGEILSGSWEAHGTPTQFIDYGGKTMFTDVPEDYKYHDYIEKAAEAGIMKGYEDGCFHPEKAVTREEMAIVASRILDKMK